MKPRFLICVLLAYRALQAPGHQGPGQRIVEVATQVVHDILTDLVR